MHQAQKDLLTQQIALQQQAEETTQAVLEEAALRGSEVVRIMPKYLVPDTNCFVSMLPSIQALVQSGHFTVAVPLIGESAVCSPTPRSALCPLQC